jgi:hypothetical protein
MSFAPVLSGSYNTLEDFDWSVRVRFLCAFTEVILISLCHIMQLILCSDKITGKQHATVMLKLQVRTGHGGIDENILELSESELNEFLQNLKLIQNVRILRAVRLHIKSS